MVPFMLAAVALLALGVPGTVSQWNSEIDVHYLGYTKGGVRQYYSIRKVEATQQGAINACKYWGMELLSFESQEEFERVVEFMSEKKTNVNGNLYLNTTRHWTGNVSHGACKTLHKGQLAAESCKVSSVNGPGYRPLCLQIVDQGRSTEQPEASTSSSPPEQPESSTEGWWYGTSEQPESSSDNYEWWGTSEQPESSSDNYEWWGTSEQLQSSSDNYEWWGTSEQPQSSSDNYEWWGTSEQPESSSDNYEWWGTSEQPESSSDNYEWWGTSEQPESSSDNYEWWGTSEQPESSSDNYEWWGTSEQPESSSDNYEWWGSSEQPESSTSEQLENSSPNYEYWGTSEPSTGHCLNLDQEYNAMVAKRFVQSMFDISTFTNQDVSSDFVALAGRNIRDHKGNPLTLTFPQFERDFVRRLSAFGNVDLVISQVNTKFVGPTVALNARFILAGRRFNIRFDIDINCEGKVERIVDVSPLYKRRQLQSILNTVASG